MLDDTGYCLTPLPFPAALSFAAARITVGLAIFFETGAEPVTLALTGDGGSTDPANEARSSASPADGVGLSLLAMPSISFAVTPIDCRQ